MKSMSPFIVISLICCFIFLSCNTVEASLDPNSSVSIENNSTDIFVCSTDPVYQETNGKYTTEDFQSATPVEMPVAEESWLESLLNGFVKDDTLISSDAKQLIPFKQEPIHLYPQSSYIHCLLSAHMNIHPFTNYFFY